MRFSKGLFFNVQADDKMVDSLQPLMTRMGKGGFLDGFKKRCACRIWV